MGNKTVWIECRLGPEGKPFWFPGHNLQHAKAVAIESFVSLAVPPEDLVFKEYAPRKRIMTPRRRRKVLAKRAMATR